jgi:selenocysteine lyase/cysteine desulfurase
VVSYALLYQLIARAREYMPDKVGDLEKALAALENSYPQVGAPVRAVYAGRVALVAITGGSNVSGFINPVYRLAEKAHKAGAQILVDCAQLAPHRKVDVLPHADPRHLDYVTLSAHKLYAPFGSGALVGRRVTFENGDPEYRGGGQVDIVTLDSVVWSAPPERDESGSPNTVGAVALAAAVQQLQAVGMEQVAAHEADLTAYTLPRLQKVPGLRIFGDADPACATSRRFHS